LFCFWPERKRSRTPDASFISINFEAVQLSSMILLPTNTVSNKKEAALNSLNTASLSCTVSCLFTLTGWLKAAIIYTCSVGK